MKEEKTKWMIGLWLYPSEKEEIKKTFKANGMNWTTFIYEKVMEKVRELKG